MKISLFDKEFAHLSNYCGYDQYAKIEWDRRDKNHDIGVYSERCYQEVKLSKNKIKVAWALEPPEIHAYAYNDLVTNGMHEYFDYILTFDKLTSDVLFEKSLAKPIFWTPGGSWIWLRDWQLYQKTRNVSIVAGMKDWTVGHKLRHEVINRFGSKFDLICGYGRNPVEPKLEIFKDYRYSVVIENCRRDYYWSDKLIDCFACGTIPIFWGCPSIGDYFNRDGIIQFANIDELEWIFNHVGEHDYEMRKDAIIENYKRAKKYVPVEKFMYESFFKKFDTEEYK